MSCKRVSSFTKQSETGYLIMLIDFIVFKHLNVFRQYLKTLNEIL